MATIKKSVKKTLKNAPSVFKGQGSEESSPKKISPTKKAAHSKQHPTKLGYHGTDKETDLNVEE